MQIKLIQRNVAHERINERSHDTRIGKGSPVGNLQAAYLLPDSSPKSKAVQLHEYKNNIILHKHSWLGVA